MCPAEVQAFWQGDHLAAPLACLGDHLDGPSQIFLESVTFDQHLAQGQLQSTLLRRVPLLGRLSPP
jgi:hypothetical protein